MDAALKDIKNGSLKNLYLFYGPERFLINRYVEIAKEHIADSAGMNVDIFNGRDAGADEIINAAETLPFLSERRLVAVRDSQLFTAGRKADSDRLAEYLAQTPDYTVIIFVETEIDKRGRMYKSVAEFGAAIEFGSPPDNELTRWLVKIAEKGGKRLSHGTAAALLRHVSGSMEDYATEMAKLISFADGDEITISDIEAVCTKSLEAKIFDLVDAIGNKNPETALLMYTNLIFAKESPFDIMSMIARQFRLILQCGHLRKKGLSSAQIAAQLSQREFAARKCVDQSANFTERRLLDALNDCLKTDYNIKTGQMEAKLAVELLILKYSGL